MVNKVKIVPFDGWIEHEPDLGGWLTSMSNIPTTVSFGNVYLTSNRQNNVWLFSIKIDFGIVKFCDWRPN